MGQAIGAALALGGTIAFGMLIRHYTGLGIAAATGIGLLCTILSMALLLFGYGVYEVWQQELAQAANAKRVCKARVELNADLIAQGKPALYPSLTLADCN